MLFNFIKKAKQNEKGFTLVELMVVVLIIGVLVAIAVPVYNSATARAETSACDANKRIIDAAVLMWQMEQDNPSTEIPDSIEDLSGFFQETPKCPSGGTYTLDTNGTTCSKHDGTDE